MNFTDDDLIADLGLNQDGAETKRKLFSKFGVSSNPFPASGQTSDHPRKPGPSDIAIRQRLKSFFDNRQSQVIVVTGNQGVGKTNLLESYRKSLPRALANQSGFYVIQYLADPEPRFTGVILKILDEFGIQMLRDLVDALSEKDYRELLGRLVGSPELKEALLRVVVSKTRSEAVEERVVQISEYLHGVRMLKVHYESLGIRFSLTTQEQKTSALRDIVNLARELGLVRGILLFMDELEKLGDMTLRNTLGYLSAIRAMIDALPHSLFLVLAMTETARNQYQRVFPSLAGRFGNPISLGPLQDQDEALGLGQFYVTEARARARLEMAELKGGNSDVVSAERMRTIFDELLKKQTLGRGYVVQREYLDALHIEAQAQIQL